MIPALKSQVWLRPKSIKPINKGEKAAAEHIVLQSLNNLLPIWFKRQRFAEQNIPFNFLTEEEHLYLDKGSKKYGCILPPCRDYRPTTQDLDKATFTLSSEDASIVTACLEIAACSSLPWAHHHSNTSQAIPPLAISFLSLYHDKANIYGAYLGQDIVWDLYIQMAGILDDISHGWVPWHGITEVTRDSSSTQLAQANRGGHAISPIVGVAIAQSAAEVNLKFSKALSGIWKIVENTCGIPVEDSEVEEGSSHSVRKYGGKVLKGVQDLVEVSTRINTLILFAIDFPKKK